MIKYNVRSRQLIDIVNDIMTRRIILSPFFQRNLVWRTIHKIDFIETILMGLPFPEIFIAKGDLDIDAMTTTSCIVDGQQRLNSIVEYIQGKFEVKGRKYEELSPEEKENFLKYEIAVIELDIQHDDPSIQELFKRLNRTYYSLSNIEKISTEYAASEFMLVAKYLCKEISNETNEEEEIFPDPNITKEFKEWMNITKVKNFNKLILDMDIFSNYEISRQVHLNFVLNILGTIQNGFFNRNVDKSILDVNADIFYEKDEITNRLEEVANKILKVKFKKKSYWYNKANMYSIIIAFYNNYSEVELMDNIEIKNKFEDFEVNLPTEYKISAKEGVNNKKERLLRNKYIERLLNLYNEL